MTERITFGDELREINRLNYTPTAEKLIRYIRNAIDSKKEEMRAVARRGETAYKCSLCLNIPSPPDKREFDRMEEEIGEEYGFSITIFYYEGSNTLSLDIEWKSRNDNTI